MDIKDLAGLGITSKSIRRLIEVLASGVGYVCAPMLKRKLADATLHEAHMLKQALGELSSIDNLRISYSGGQLEVLKEPTQISSSSSIDDPMVAERVGFRERRRQSNIEEIASNAALDLSGVSDVPDQAPLDDWVVRFFSIAQDISDEEMQLLWARILSGEIKNPGTFSLRTLDLVRNLSQDEARTFERVGRFAIETDDGNRMIPDECRKWLAEKRNLKYTDFVLMTEIGLMSPNPIGYVPCAMDPPEPSILVFGETALIVERVNDNSKAGISTYRFTRSGAELLSFIESVNDEEYMLAVGSELVRKKFKVQIGTIAEKHPDRVRVVGGREIAVSDIKD